MSVAPSDLKPGDEVVLRNRGRQLRATVRAAYNEGFEHDPRWRVEFTNGMNWKQQDGGTFERAAKNNPRGWRDRTPADLDRLEEERKRTLQWFDRMGIKSDPETDRMAREAEQQHERDVHGNFVVASLEATAEGNRWKEVGRFEHEARAQKVADAKTRGAERRGGGIYRVMTVSDLSKLGQTSLRKRRVGGARENPGDILLDRIAIGDYVQWRDYRGRKSTAKVVEIRPDIEHLAVDQGSAPEKWLRYSEVEHVRFAVPKKTGELKKNPGELLIVNPHDDLDSARAEKVYEMWHKKEPRNVAVIDTGCDGDDVMVCVGKACDIVYRSGKWEKGSKKNDYVHTFDSKPSVYMLDHLVEGLPRENPSKTVESLLARAKNADGQFAVAELASPLSLSLDNGTSEGEEIAIHPGSKVYGAVDKKTIIICDPSWRLIVIKGGAMHFDERGIVK